MVGSKVIIFALALIIYTTWVQANDTENNFGTDDQRSVTNLTIQDAPYVVALIQNDNIIGSGSIVQHNFILTSASAVARANNNTFGVKVGSDGFFRSGHLIEVEQLLCHENYAEHENDICLLKLKTPVTVWRNVAKIDLTDNDLPLNDGLFVDITGWGETENGTSTGQLQRTHIPVLQQYECGSSYPGMNNNKICASTEGLDVYWGNTGAPMTYNNMQIGVASLNLNSECSKNPSVYTKVSKYVDWIKTKIPDL